MFEYKFFIIPLLALIINQIIKIIIFMVKGEFSWSQIFSYGGMPSSHTALATSLLITMGYFQGVSSPEFAIALIISIVIVKDAAGIRRKLGKQAQIINHLIKKLPDKEEYKFPILNERYGHTMTEILVGLLISVVSTYLLLNIIK
ncbi:MAG: hypothetical protein A2406_04080 [Candidatus Komeilibacteria bacterium RIFOXYC1_FULL_37_11]|uniref:Acid phosphatase n=1 Tax=Candidatus Komeilibacteria bacterium RIFOXYC1_FULL_37_11 TaxID=1798555 RepID=A0A1G2BXP8_9BACT|nr:MAG: hypothetical protein A2406_04080 [Candidatus Komeilibacteria bacterium RIFOXYC1_FULL_37_11]OGY95840.1 MAG: hypothetical protein A2611_03640 [Candidatus Komeilibacteria bacterium RIFOXYD1_FULL_37_29]